MIEIVQHKSKSNSKNITLKLSSLLSSSMLSKKVSRQNGKSKGISQPHTSHFDWIIINSKRKVNHNNKHTWLEHNTAHTHDRIDRFLFRPPRIIKTKIRKHNRMAMAMCGASLCRLLNDFAKNFVRKSWSQAIIIRHTDTVPAAAATNTYKAPNTWAEQTIDEKPLYYIKKKYAKWEKN